MKKIWIIVLFSLGLGNILLSQSYPFRHYTVLDGMPQSQVTVLFQDSMGFIWIGTRNGVSRFDGRVFVNYGSNEGLPSNLIRGVFENDEGVVTVLTDKGFSSYDGIGFHYYKPDESMGEFMGLFLWSPEDRRDKVYAVTLTSEGSPIVSFGNGKYERMRNCDIEIESEGLRPYLNNEKPANHDSINREIVRLYNVWNSASAKHGGEPSFGFRTNRWNFNTPDGRLILSSDLIHFEDQQLPEKPLNKGPWYVRGYESDKRVSVVGPEGFSNFRWYGGLLNMILVDKDGTAWLGTEDGIYRLISPAFQNFTEKDGLENNVWSIVEERNGDILFASLGGYLQRYDGKSISLYESFPHQGKGAFYIGSRHLYNGDVLLSYDEGVIRKSGNTFSKVREVTSQTELVWQNPNDSTVFIGSVNELLHLRDDVVLNRYPQFSSTDLGWASDMDIDPQGTVWLITNKTVAYLQEGSFKVCDEGNVPSSHWYSIECSGDGHVWIGGQAGLYFKDENGMFINVLPQGINQTVNLLEMVNDTILLAGRMVDIVLVNIAAYKRGDNVFWRVIDNTDGFLGLESEQNAVVKDKNGHFWISTTGMVVKIDPAFLTPSMRPPEVYVTGYDIITTGRPEEEFFPFNLYDDLPNEIRLRHNENSLRVFVTAISTGNPDKIRYKYRFVGEEWSDPFMEHRFFLTALKPGKYYIEVIAAGVGGVWSTTPSVLTILIAPAFYQTRLFQILIFILIPFLAGSTGFWIRGRRVRRIEEKEKMTNRIKSLQIQNIARQFDPHFTFNIVSSVGGLIMMGEKEKAYDSLISFSDILRGILADPGVVLKPLADELLLLDEYCKLQTHKLGTRLSYRIEVDKSVDTSVKFPRMVIVSFVENSIKHGIEPKVEGGSVIVSVYSEGEGVIIDITDNGIGREASKKRKTFGTGSGIRLTDSLFEYLNDGEHDKISYTFEDLFEDGTPPAGTKVRIYVPHRFQM